MQLVPCKQSESLLAPTDGNLNVISSTSPNLHCSPVSRLSDNIPILSSDNSQSPPRKIDACEAENQQQQLLDSEEYPRSYHGDSSQQPGSPSQPSFPHDFDHFPPSRVDVNLSNLQDDEHHLSNGDDALNAESVKTWSPELIRNDRFLELTSVKSVQSSLRISGSTASPDYECTPRCGLNFERNRIQLEVD